MAEFNPDLHAVLLENETCMWVEYGTTDDLKFGVHIPFDDIRELIDAMGHSVLDDGGIDCNLNNDATLYVPLEDYFLNWNLSVMHYKHCFDESNIRNYAKQIAAFDRD